MANGALIRTEASDASAQQGGPSQKKKTTASGAPARQGGPSKNHGKWYTGPAGWAKYKQRQVVHWPRRVGQVAHRPGRVGQV